jgi:hypothetical protein
MIFASGSTCTFQRILTTCSLASEGHLFWNSVSTAVRVEIAFPNPLRIPLSVFLMDQLQEFLIASLEGISREPEKRMRSCLLSRRWLLMKDKFVVPSRRSLHTTLNEAEVRGNFSFNRATLPSARREAVVMGSRTPEPFS